jgi:antirestriction protein ArdC
LPPREAFKTREHDQATTLHELGHWTKHGRRLNRRFGQKCGDEAYAVEELVAELSAAFLCADLEVTGQLQHAEYLVGSEKATSDWNMRVPGRYQIL